MHLGAAPPCVLDFGVHGRASEPKAARPGRHRGPFCRPGPLYNLQRSQACFKLTRLPACNCVRLQRRALLFTAAHSCSSLRSALHRLAFSYGVCLRGWDGQ